MKTVHPMVAVTPDSLNYILSGLEDGDKLEFTMIKGKLEIVLKTKGESTKRLENRISSAVGRQPVTNSWLPGVWGDDGSGREKRSAAKRAADKASLNENNKKKDLVRDMLLIGIMFQETGTRVHGVENLIMFEVGEYQVFTRENRTLVKYVKGGETVFL